MTINKVILVGNLGNDPEIRSTSDGREIANFSLATSESWKDKNTGERKSKAEWHRIVIFSQGLVGIVKSYLKKGTKIYLEGQLQTRKWTDNSGIEKYTTEIVLQNFNSTLSILDSKQSSSDTSNKFNDNSQDQNSADDIIDDDIPF
ncbi:MAG: single-strand DNA-binding protein [Rickettsiales bacterium]|jgi:single-strand DNA-binding protein